jgi:hypothetical protein
MREAYKSLIDDSGQNGRRMDARKQEFTQKYGSGFYTWLLSNCKFSDGAKQQRLMFTHLAKFYGLSRSGITLLSTYDIMSPLSSMDRDLETLLAEYVHTMRSAPGHCVISVCLVCVQF